MAKYKMNATVDTAPTVETPEVTDDCAVETASVETTSETVEAEKPVIEIDADELTAKLTMTAPAFKAGSCYTFKMAVNVHTEPDVESLTVGVKGVTEFVIPERVLDLGGYIWAEFHSSPKHIRYVALATSDNSEQYVD